MVGCVSASISGLEVRNVLDGSAKVDVAGQDPKTIDGLEIHLYPAQQTPVQVL